MNWNRRITEARERLGITKSEFSRRVHVSTATTADWETGKIKNIDGANLVQAANVLNVSPEWLMTGRGPTDEDAPVIQEFAYTYSHSTEEWRNFLRTAIHAAKGQIEHSATVTQIKNKSK